MTKPLSEAIEALHDALAKTPRGVKPCTEAELERREEELGSEFPPPWRAVLLRCGGPKGLRWPIAGLSLSPADAVEHQVETDDGQSITERGMFVIGYIEGLGDCLTMEPDGEDPMVYRHNHSGGEEEPIGRVSELFLGIVGSLG